MLSLFNSRGGDKQWPTITASWATISILTHTHNQNGELSSTLWSHSSNTAFRGHILCVIYYAFVCTGLGMT